MPFVLYYLSNVSGSFFFPFSQNYFPFRSFLLYLYLFSFYYHCSSSDLCNVFFVIMSKWQVHLKQKLNERTKKMKLSLWTLYVSTATYVDSN